MKINLPIIITTLITVIKIICDNVIEWDKVFEDEINLRESLEIFEWRLKNLKKLIIH